MLRLLISAGVMAGSAASSGSPSDPGAPVATCLAPDSTHVAERTAYFTTLLTSTVGERARVRRALGLPVLATVRIHLVSDATLCATAVRALASHRQEPPVQSGLVVYALDAAGYAVDNPGLEVGTGEYRPIWLFDQRWRYRATLVGL